MGSIISGAVHCTDRQDDEMMTKQHRYIERGWLIDARFVNLFEYPSQKDKI